MATLVPTSLILSFSCNPLPSTSSATKIRYPVGYSSWILRSTGRKHGHGYVGSLQAAISGRSEGTFDPELRSVLELATDSELYELERILFGPSYFSPLLKSLTKRAEDDYIMLGEDYEDRQYFTELLESRFLFLAADARSTLRGWRPTYRDVLLDVRKKLRVPCSSKLSTEDLEVEIFLHLLQDYSSHESGTIPGSLESSKISRSHGSLELGLSQWKVQALAALKVGAAELQSTFLKGGGVLTLGKIFQLLARGLSGKMLFEAANYQIKHELVTKDVSGYIEKRSKGTPIGENVVFGPVNGGLDLTSFQVLINRPSIMVGFQGGRMAALKLESRAALLAARQGFAGAASRYLGLRSMMMLLGPMLWGTFLADVVIQMLGTDYARILRAIYAFAQIRIIRTYGWKTDDDESI